MLRAASSAGCTSFPNSSCIFPPKSRPTSAKTGQNQHQTHIKNRQNSKMTHDILTLKVIEHMFLHSAVLRDQVIDLLRQMTEQLTVNNCPSHPVYMFYMWTYCPHLWYLSCLSGFQYSLMGSDWRRCAGLSSYFSQASSCSSAENSGSGWQRMHKGPLPWWIKKSSVKNTN